MPRRIFAAGHKNRMKILEKRKVPVCMAYWRFLFRPTSKPSRPLGRMIRATDQSTSLLVHIRRFGTPGMDQFSRIASTLKHCSSLATPSRPQTKSDIGHKKDEYMCRYSNPKHSALTDLRRTTCITGGRQICATQARAGMVNVASKGCD